MTLLFAHDHRFIRSDDGRTLSPGKFPYVVWERYLQIFDRLIVVGRRETSAVARSYDNLNVSSGPSVAFRFLPTLTDPIRIARNRKLARRMMLDAVEESNAVVARLPSELGLLAVECAQIAGRPWLIELVGCPRDAMRYHGSLKGRLYAPLSERRVRKAVEAAPFVIYVTGSYLQARYPTSGISAVCPNAETFVDDSTIQRRLRRIATRSGPFVVGTIAPLGPQYKGLDVMLRAMSSLVANYPQIHYRILGSGDERPWTTLAARLGLQSHVSFSGSLPAGEAVNAWLDDIDLYVQPSLTEGLPRALVEAISRGCPALGSRVGGIPELIGLKCSPEPDPAIMSVLDRRTGCGRAGSQTSRS